jgi:hypothetical protein
MPNFEKMKRFVKTCGNKEFNKEHVAMMKAFCRGEDVPDFEKMKALKEQCRYNIPESKVLR